MVMYQYVNKIGKGGFGTVYKVKHKVLNTTVALKLLKRQMIRQNKQRKDQLHEEIAIMSKLNHPGIVGFYQAFRTRTTYSIAMEMVSDTNLRAYYIQEGGRINENAARLIARQIVSAVGYIHSKRIVHRDLKPDNIMVMNPDTRIKIIDFGLSAYLDPTKELCTRCGTRDYMAPEILQSQQYNSKVDMWSLGILIYEIVMGENPDVVPVYRFSSRFDENKRITYIVESTLKRNILKSNSQQFFDFLSVLLNPYPEKRADALILCENAWLNASCAENLVIHCGHKVDNAVRHEIIQELADKVNKPVTEIEQIIRTKTFSDITGMFRIMIRSRIEVDYILQAKASLRETDRKRALDDQEASSSTSKKHHGERNVEHT